MAAPGVQRYAREWFCPSRCVPRIRRILRERWRATRSATPGARRSAYRYFRSEGRLEKILGASTESLAGGPGRQRKGTDRNVCPTLRNGARIGERGHASASHKIAQDFLRSSAFLVVLCFRNGPCLAPQFEPEKCVFQRIETCAYGCIDFSQVRRRSYRRNSR